MRFTAEYRVYALSIFLILSVVFGLNALFDRKSSQSDNNMITAETARKNQGDYVDEIRSQRISEKIGIINDSIERRSKESLQWDVFFVDKDIASDILKSLTDRGFKVTTETNTASPFFVRMEVKW